MKFQKPFLYSKTIVMANKKKKVKALIKRMKKDDYEYIDIRTAKFNGMEYATVYFNKLTGI